MNAQGFTLFDTSLGRCAIAWGERGIVAVHLPEARDDKAFAHIQRRCPDAVEMPPPDEVKSVMADIVALFEGEKRDLLSARLDMMGVPEFHQRVYDIARHILPGETLTYGEVAERLGDKNASRAVGVALGKNPFPIIVPCHRVLAADGKTGGFSARGGVETKMKMLTIEGAKTSKAPTLFDNDENFILSAKKPK